MSKDLLRIATTLQSLALVNENVKEVKKKKPNLVKLGVKNIIGTSLIKTQADLI